MMLSILRFSSSGLGSDSLGEALLNLTFLRLGINRARSIENCPIICGAMWAFCRARKRARTCAISAGRPSA
jgi:hypothetical protein